MKKIKILSSSKAVVEISKLTQAAIPFFVLTDFEGLNAIVLKVKDCDKLGVRFDFSASNKEKKHQIKISKYPIDYEAYENKFNFVLNELNKGNTFLVNLTSKSSVELNLNLSELYEVASERYKVLIENELCFFSPEIFIQIDENGVVSSFPMKGTIDASLENAELRILADVKELHEHTTIVDLIRNDISMIAEKVWVERFRYIEKIKKNDGSEILQISSEIKGILPKDWKINFGELLFKLLPAGSISGAPKQKTVEIIQQVENEKRGFYTGIAGFFDGKKFDSCVAIRFIEQNEDGLFYRSGGGITTKSDVYQEYLEMIQKIYVPVF